MLITQELSQLELRARVTIELLLEMRNEGAHPVTFPNLLLHLSSYPEPPGNWVFEAGAALAEELDASLSMLLWNVDIPRVSNWLADRIARVGDALAGENLKSQQNFARLQSGFASLVSPERRGEQLAVDGSWPVLPESLPRMARTYDLGILPTEKDADIAETAEALIFESGKPLLLLPQTSGNKPLERIAVGWDGSRTAARAVADALPLLARAKEVSILQVTDEKAVPEEGRLTEVQRQLKRHGIAAKPVEVLASGRDAGTALQAHCLEADDNLLVMGGYGHSRVREFVLGGATRAILQQPRLPIFLSH